MFIYFEITNLTNDKTIAFVPQVDEENILQAMKTHNIGIEDIGIFIREGDEDAA